jgi:ubiquinone biosynthesis protein
MVVAMRLLAIALTAVLIVVSVVAIVGAFALLARRLLGMRFGLVRLLLAGLVGFAVAGPIARSLAGAVPTTGPAVTPVWFLILAGACALLVAMVFLVIAEALVPSGSLPGPLEWRRAELDTPEGRARPARSLRQALEDGGVTFVKLGQVLSTRSDLLAPEFTDELGRLRDQATPAPWPQVEQVLGAELDAPATRCSPASTASRWRPPPSPRCTPPACGRAPRWR